MEKLELLVPEKLQQEKESSMKNKTDELRKEYDLSKLKNRVRGKYTDQYAQGTNVILLESDVIVSFPDSKSVNQALRMLINVAKTQKTA